MEIYHKVALLCLTVLISLGAADAQDTWTKADKEVRRLRPQVFTQLPLLIRKDLEKRGCTIPQCCEDKKPHNVARGSFVHKGQTDWIVLCSTGRVSSIMVYVAGSPRNVLITETLPDLNFLQSMGENNIMYSRSIGRIPDKSILKMFLDAGRQVKLSDIHDGIADMFAEKGSAVYYYENRKWTQVGASH